MYNNDLTIFICLKQHFIDFNKFLSSNSFSLAKYPSLQFQLTEAEIFPCNKVFPLELFTKDPCPCLPARCCSAFFLSPPNSLLPAKVGALKWCFWAAMLAVLLSFRKQCGSHIKLYHWPSSCWIKVPEHCCYSAIKSATIYSSCKPWMPVLISGAELPYLLKEAVVILTNLLTLCSLCTRRVLLLWSNFPGAGIHSTLLTWAV